MKSLKKLIVFGYNLIENIKLSTQEKLNKEFTTFLKLKI